MAEIVTSAAELSKLLAEERARNRLLHQQLEVERHERVKVETMLVKFREKDKEMFRGSDSGCSSNGGEVTGAGGKTSPTTLEESSRSREQRLLLQLEKMKRKVELMQLERENLALRVETEEDMLSNNLLRKLRVVQKEKEALQLELSRSSRSSSLDHSVDSSIAGSLASENHASEVSSFSHIACSSAVSDSEGFPSRKKKLPPPPVEVGEK